MHPPTGERNHSRRNGPPVHPSLLTTWRLDGDTLRWRVLRLSRAIGRRRRKYRTATEGSIARMLGGFAPQSGMTQLSRFAGTCVLQYARQALGSLAPSVRPVDYSSPNITGNGKESAKSTSLWDLDSGHFTILISSPFTR